MKATSITIKYDTGQLDVADGDRAAQIFAWWGSCEMFACQHGTKYAGPDDPGSSAPAPLSVAEEDWELVADEFAAALIKDRRTAGEACALLLAVTGRRASESEAVLKHAENGRGVAAAGRLANQDGKQTSARTPSSGEVSAARQTGAGKASTAALQNGQNESHYHTEEASVTYG